MRAPVALGLRLRQLDDHPTLVEPDRGSMALADLGLDEVHAGDDQASAPWQLSDLEHVQPLIALGPEGRRFESYRSDHLSR
jgi:hypothetical protein